MPTLTGPGRRLEGQRPARGQRQVVLADLVALGQVGIEVVLAVPARHVRDARADRHPGGQHVAHRQPVDDRQRSGHAEADRAGVRVGRRLLEVGRAAAEHLRGRPQLDVDLDADDGLPGRRRRARSRRQRLFGMPASARRRGQLVHELFRRALCGARQRRPARGRVDQADDLAVPAAQLPRWARCRIRTRVDELASIPT